MINYAGDPVWATQSDPVRGEAVDEDHWQPPWKTLADRFAYLKRIAISDWAEEGAPLVSFGGDNVVPAGGFDPVNVDYGSDLYPLSLGADRGYIDISDRLVGDKILVRAFVMRDEVEIYHDEQEWFLLAIDDVSGTPVQTRLIGTTMPVPLAADPPYAQRNPVTLRGVWTVTRPGTTRVAFGVKGTAPPTYNVAQPFKVIALTAITFPPGPWSPEERLFLTGDWRGSYESAPWIGTRSFGTSEDHAIDEATHPPVPGPAVNGYTPALFNGTSAFLISTLTCDNFLSAGSYSGLALVYVNAVATDSASAWENDHVADTQGIAYWGIYLRSSGSVGIYHYDGSYHVATGSFAIGQWILLQFDYDGTHIRLRVNGGAWCAPVAAGHLHTGFASQIFQVGRSPDSTHFLDGMILDIKLSQDKFSDDEHDALLAYMRVRYDLPLT